MDFNSIAALLIATFVIITSSVNCRNYETDEDYYFGSHRRSVRQVLARKNQECIPLERPAKNYSELFDFGETFSRLLAGLKNIEGSSSSGDVIIFVGNTGVGKSSLVHLLAGNTSHFTAVEEFEGTNMFRILDTTGEHVSISTIDSKTTYPKAFADADSGLLLFDTPGFRDTRSSIHEVIATCGLKRVAETSKRIKFALLVNHDALTSAGPRDDFTNSLQSLFSLLKNAEKYKVCTHLVATKVANQYSRKNGQFVPISDDTYINAIVNYLRGVETSMKNREDNTNDNKQQFLSVAQSFIRDLVDNRARISLFRKPDEDGPIMNSESIRRSVAAIRQSLLNIDGYVKVEVDDFGFTLSNTAKLYIQQLFDLMNKYLIDVSKLFTMSFEHFLVAKHKNFVDITAIMASLVKTKHDVDMLIKSTNASQYPNQFADALWSFVNDVGTYTCSNDTLREIKQLNDFLSHLRNVTNKSLYSPGEWANSLFSIEQIAKNEQDYYHMLNNLFEKLTDHSALDDDFPVGISMVLKKHNKRSMLVDKHNYAVFMQHLGLDQFSGENRMMNQDRLNEINNIYLKAKHHHWTGGTVFCENNTLVIVGSFLQLQTLDKSKIASCEHATTVALLATNKLYIDTNLGVDVLGGRNLVIIAPEWQVMGKFVISVDGASRSTAEPKAANGLVGVDGKPGQSAGKFIGIALRYFNSGQLTITANGGNGQDGQAGGDGNDGKDGHDGSKRTLVDRSATIFIVYNRLTDTSIIKADQGTSGGDAGMGGVGGAGGFSGSIEMHSLTTHSPDCSSQVMLNGTEGNRGDDGKPGRGGLRGCDKLIEDTGRLYLIIPTRNIEQTYLQCERRNSDGHLVSNEARYSEAPSAVPETPPLCELYAKLSSLFEPMNDIFSHQLFEEFQRIFNEKFHCNI